MAKGDFKKAMGALSPTEQLEELHAANRELIRQHKDDIRSGDIRAKAIRRGLDQLADKERKLTAANAVVEDIEALLRDDSKSGNWVCGKIAHVIAKWRKLKGGE